MSKQTKPSADDPWGIRQETFDWRRTAHYETILALANGYMGVRGSLSISPDLAAPGFYAAGVYGDADNGRREIVNLPCWLGLQANVDGFPFDLKKGEVISFDRRLDMRQAVLYADITWQDDAKRRWRWQTARLLHQRQRHLALVRGTITPLDVSGTLALASPIDAHVSKYGSGSCSNHYGDLAAHDLGADGIAMTVPFNDGSHTVAIVAHTKVEGKARRSVRIQDDKVSETLRVAIEKGKPLEFEKRVVLYTSRDVDDPAAAARDDLARARRRSAKQLTASHTRAWDRRWQQADVEIDGDAETQHDLRVSLYHLMALENDFDPKASLGAKGLHGPGYDGRVFWDTEVYLVPFFTFTNPKAARTLLEYRYHLLPQARRNATAKGRRGAYFPWTCDDGATRYERSDGWQEHIHGDIAWTVDQYVQATGDRQFYRDMGAELIIAAAQYYADRVDYDADRDEWAMNCTMGPDEIHGGIRNNAFTNHLVRWNLERALQAVDDLQADDRWAAVNRRCKVKPDDLEQWHRIAAGLPTLYDKRRGFHEQFEGYFKLPDKKIDRSMTKMEYTGPVQHSFKPTKVAQQADTMVMYYLFPDDFDARVKAAAYKYYEPRCSHTSTLSPSIFSAVAAHSGLVSEARRLFTKSLQTDIGPTAECDSGIHAACLGGNWQTAVMGFAHFRIRDGKPCFADVHPHLPEGWTRLAFTLKWRNRTVHVEITADGLQLRTARGNLRAFVGDALQTITPRGIRA